MQKKRKSVLASFLVLAALLLSALSINAVSAHGSSQKPAPLLMKQAQGYQRLSTKATFAGEVDMNKIPKETPGQA